MIVRCANFTVKQVFFRKALLLFGNSNHSGCNTEGDESSAPLTVSFRLAIAPAPVPAGLAAVPSFLSPPDVAVALVPVLLPEPVENEIADPSSPKRLLPLIQVCLSDTSDESLPSDNLQETNSVCS